MRILFVSGSLNRGGAERVITLLAEEYRKRGDEVHLAVLLDSKQGYKVNDAIILHDIVHRGGHLKYVSKWISGLRNILQQVKPNVVVSFAGRINMITMLVARGLGIPVLISERNGSANDRRNRLEQRFGNCAE